VGFLASKIMKVKLSKKLHNELFPRRKYNIFQKYEYELYENHLTMKRYINVFGKIFLVLVFPINVLIEGFLEAYKETKHMLFQNKYGSWCGDTVYDKKILDVIRKANNVN
jgi:hypothetical protein